MTFGERMRHLMGVIWRLDWARLADKRFWQQLIGELKDPRFWSGLVKQATSKRFWQEQGERVKAFADQEEWVQKLLTFKAGLSALAGLVTTLALFYLMQALISGANAALTSDKSVTFEITRVKDVDELQRGRQQRPPEPETPPEDTPPPEFEAFVPETTNTLEDVSVNTGLGDFSIDGEYLPIVKVQPVYPRRALTRGIAGWVIVEFTVTRHGTVENPVVVENCGWVQNSANRDEECFESPNSIFDAAARKAALKFKYKPKVRDGKEVATHRVPHKITFELTDEQ